MELREPYRPGFRLACREILEFLSVAMPMTLWMVTRVNDNEWTIIDSVDELYGTKPLNVYDWSTSFSYRMILGLGPKVAPRSSEVPAYVNAPVNSSSVAAYIGVPLEMPDGRLFGVITGINKDPMSNDLHKVLPELENYARCLMHLYAAESHALKLELKQAHFEFPQWTDESTGALIFNAWLNDCVEADHARFDYIEPAGIFAVHLPDQHLDFAKHVVDRLKEACGRFGTVYREDQNSIFVLVRDQSQNQQKEIYSDIRKSLAKCAPEVKTAHVYRKPAMATAQALVEAKKQIHSRRQKSAA